MALNQTEFNTLRQEAETARVAINDTVKSIESEAANVQRLERLLALENDKANPDQGLITQWTAERDDSTQNIAAYKGSLTAAEANMKEAIRQLVVYDDPRALVGRLNDSKPVFMFPVRVETRFMRIKHVTRIQPKYYAPEEERPIYGEQAVTETFQVESIVPGENKLPLIEDGKELWVRIFPDDIAVHTHEPGLTDFELEGGKNYWTEMWYAADDEARQIGAWRALIAGIGAQRAAWVSRQTEPTNGGDQPTSPVNREDPLPILPIFPSPLMKTGAWTEAPKSKVMPDCFVVRLYNGSSYREVIGKPIPNPLVLSLDPNDDETEYDFDDGTFDLPEKLKWLTDFHEAEKVGMSLRIELQGNEDVTGFDRVLVLGVKTSVDENTGKELLEELIDNHHYTDGGISLLPQGTPTNNTESVRAGYSLHGFSEEDTFRIEQGSGLFTPVTDDKFKTDGQHLAEALGIGFDKVEHLGFADGLDIKDGMCMNRALWPATLGYYLEQAMHPIFTKQEIGYVKEHFNKFVLGRGRIPAIRVDDQPYGILPVTAFSKWKDFGTDNKTKFRNRMLNTVLKQMEAIWNGLLGNVKHAHFSDPDLDSRDLFMEVLGLHASSVEYYQRFAGGPYFMWNLFNFHQKLTTSNPVNAVPYEGTMGFEGVFSDLNFSWLAPPRIFGFGYLGDQRYLNGPVIDTLPLSEQRIVEKVGSGTENYLKWLKISNYQTVLTENFSNIGAGGANPPKALLYLLLRQAALLEYVNTGLSILVAAEEYPAEAAIEAELVNIVEGTMATEETRDLIQSYVTVELGIPREESLTQQTEDEFAYRESQGWLEEYTEAQIEAMKLDYKNNLRGETQGQHEQSILQETSSRVETFRAITSRTGILNEVNQRVHPELTLSDYIGEMLSQQNAQVAEMQELRDAINCLCNTPTARLERAFAEHIDLASYRLDSWFYSLVLDRLDTMRLGGANRDEGTYLGAYSWLEDLRPSATVGLHVEEVDIASPLVTVLRSTDPIPPIAPEVIATPEEPVYYKKLSDRTSVVVGESNIRDTLNVAVERLGKRWTYLGSDSAAGIVYDAASDGFVIAPQTNADNQGYVHAPSLNHATTAAILRAGYEAHSLNTASPDDTLAVNLTSARVRRALNILEGIRNGQELGALLGYQLERGLHDHNLELDEFILEIRNEFSLVANRVVESSGSGTLVTNGTEAEAYNVVDGLKLVENSRDPQADYPYGITPASLLPTAASAKGQAIIAEVTKLHEVLDATNDLLLSESVYQVVQGNHNRAGATLDSLAGKVAPTEPEIIHSPRSKHIITHKVGVMFDMQGGGADAWAVTSSPRSLVEPHLNRWLSTMLPAPTDIRIAVEYRDLSAAENDPWTTSQVYMSDLRLQPIDLFQIMAQPSSNGEAVELVNRVAYYVRASIAGADDIAVKVLLMDKTNHTSAQYSVFELTPLLMQLHKVASASKPLEAEDFLLPEVSDAKIEANPTAGYVTSALEARLNAAVANSNMINGEYALGKVVDEITAHLAVVDAFDYNALPGNASTLLNNLRIALVYASAFSPQNGIPASSIDFSEEIAKAMSKLARNVLGELSARLNKAGDILGALTGLSETKKAEKLREAAQAIFGRGFKVYPEFKYYDSVGFEAARTYGNYLYHAGPLAIEEWTQGVSQVRTKVNAFHKSGLYSSSLLANDGPQLSLAQMPLKATDNAWLGMEFPDDHEIPSDNLSLLIDYPSVYDNAANALHAGFMIDEWVEEIPELNANTGIAIHYDNPNSEPPQACLLAVTPEITGAWEWDDLMDTLYETLDWAKKRAVDPDLVGTTPLAQVLPATVATISGTGDSPSLDYGMNIVYTPPAFVGPLQLDEYASIFTE